jgi:non-ribosomal peptide synthetase component F
MVSDAEVSILITEENLQSKATKLATQQVVCFDADRSAIRGESTDNPENIVAPENLAYVIFTSGSTGKSKGAMIEHHSVVSAYAGWEDAYKLSAVKSHLQMANFSFDVFTAILYALCAAARGSFWCRRNFCSNRKSWKI